MRCVPAWVDKVQDRDKVEQCIYDLCFNPDGSQLVVAAGQRVLVYDTSNGSLIQPLKGHKDSVYCVCYAKDGKRFASGSADKTVIIWTSKLEGVLKYNHSDAVQCLAYNPVTHHLVSCAVSDFAFWVAEAKAVTKHKTSRVNACAWSSDGQHLALGLAVGAVSIRNKAGEEKVRIDRPNAVWALAFSPSKDENGDILCVTDWGQAMSFYTVTGKLVGKERSLGSEPLCVRYLDHGEYILLSGSDNCCHLVTKDGIKLGVVGDQQSSWVWCCAARPNSNYVALGCQDGTIAYYQLVFSTVHGLYKERYAYRENMTDVIIQHLLTDQKVRIKCRDLVKKIAIYKHRLAVQLPERVVIYELYSGEPTGMHYRVKEKINHKLQCNLLVVCSDNLVLCQEKRLQSLMFDGVKVREWVMESPIRYIKVIGGPAGREGLLLGLLSGQVLKIFLDNVFPVPVVRAGAGVRCLDLSTSRRRLALVDEAGLCSVYDTLVRPPRLLYTEQGANSVAWNTSCEDMLCFSGNNTLSIKAADFPLHQQKLMGFVVGFCGSKIFCLHVSTMAAIEVPLSAPMYQYLEKKQFREAYSIACMGVADGDWKALAHSALEHLDLSVASKAFARIRDLRYLELINDFQERQSKGEKEKEALLGELLAYKGRFKDAARAFQRCNQEHKALAMYTDLRMFDQAQDFLGSGDNIDRKALLRKKADWACNINEPRAAAEMYLSAGDTLKALDIIGANGWVDMLVEVGRKLDKAEVEAIRAVASHLSNCQQLALASEMYQKLGDQTAVVKLHVAAGQWTEAFALVDNMPELKHLVHGPYAHWLAEHDRFIEAQKAFHQAGQPEQAFKVLHHLTLNAVNETRFNDAGYYYWLLSCQCLDIANKVKEQESEMITKFHEYEKYSSIYYAYHVIQRYLEEPFTSYQPEALFNIARYLLHETKAVNPTGVSQFAILYALSKQARTLGAYKLARQALDKMQSLRIPPQFQEYVDIASMMVRAKPYHDNEDLLIMCYRCSSYNPLLANSSVAGNCCTNCRQPFIHSFVTFEVLPLVEFQLEPGVTDVEAARLLEAPGTQSEAWTQRVDEHSQTLRLDDTMAADPFTARLVSFESEADQFEPVVVNRSTLKAMDPGTVVICKWPPPLHYQYYRSLLPELQISVCHSCNKMFHTDDFEMKILQHGHCPFCRSPPPSNVEVTQM
ncbi:intraflagellar transport protein 122 homolog [Macrosteles quadrilineatus]|uniref:intraflagellar transport protein 122 homolog n=1 Tax=Macrosteles quadrilineatus TaxID=74068 RepID=UPI0023E1B109|nr:intraflagellar transport protein 122 homolog [Macrosteles quadrilineatus]